MRDVEHVREIERVLQGRPTARDSVVLASWRRCVERHGLDPARSSPAHIVPEAQLRAHREQAERLIAIARSGLESLFRQVAGQNYVLLLADAKGVTVDFFGDPRFQAELQAAGLYLGSDWSEHLAGTCGVGACIATGEAVTIHQSDHFDLHHTPLSCTAAPIFDMSGQLAAVLDLSLLRSPQPKASQNLAMTLVRTAARRVEMANLMAMARREWVLRLSSSPEFLEVDPEAAVALDGAGTIIGMTHAARTALDPQLLGRRLDEVTALTVDDLPDLMRGRPAEDRVIRLPDGRALFGHAIAPQTVRLPRQGTQLPGGLSSLAGPDPQMQALLERAARLAGSRIALLIRGETGTGKERLARAIHMCRREGGCFRLLDCAALEAGALDLPPGPGTLVLKGVEDLDPAAQALLLRRLADCPLRIIATTRCDLAQMVRDGRFRPDLFFRIAGAALDLPPLHLRQDMDWLIERMLRGLSPDTLRLSAGARAELKSRLWPGNLRELAATLEAAALIAGGTVIDTGDLPPPLLAPAPAAGEPELPAILDACGWNMALAAKRLGVNRSTVLRRVRAMGLTPPS